MQDISKQLVPSANQRNRNDTICRNHRTASLRILNCKSFYKHSARCCRRRPRVVVHYLLVAADGELPFRATDALPRLPGPPSRDSNGRNSGELSMLL